MPRKGGFGCFGSRSDHPEIRYGISDGSGVQVLREFSLPMPEESELNIKFAELVVSQQWTQNDLDSKINSYLVDPLGILECNSLQTKWTQRRRAEREHNQLWRIFIYQPNNFNFLLWNSITNPWIFTSSVSCGPFSTPENLLLSIIRIFIDHKICYIGYWLESRQNVRSFHCPSPILHLFYNL